MTSAARVTDVLIDAACVARRSTMRSRSVERVDGRDALEDMTFHHLGIASEFLDSDARAYEALGYSGRRWIRRRDPGRSGLVHGRRRPASGVARAAAGTETFDPILAGE